MKSFLSTVLFFSFLIGMPMVINGHDLKSAVDSMIEPKHSKLEISIEIHTKR